MAFAPAPGAAAEQPASLTEWLRRRTDAQLTELLHRRPDLALPAPSDLATLASRLSVRTSVQRALDGLDAFALRVVEALVLASDGRGPVRLADAVSLLRGDGSDSAEPDVDEDDVRRALDELCTLALAWGPAEAIRLVAALPEAVGPYPGGLGRPAAILVRGVPDVALAPVLRALGLDAAAQPQAGYAVAAVLADAQRLAELLANCDAEEREVLDRLAAGPPIGTVRNALLPAAGLTDPHPSAPHRLIVRGLLLPVDAQTVELPREVALALRGRPLPPVSARPPQIQAVERTPAEHDAMGTTAVLEALRLVDALAHSWTVSPPAMLRSGGLGSRDLRRTARDLGVDERVAALVIETAYAAGLIAPTTGIEPVYLPTGEFDEWHARDSARRWIDLASAWLDMSRLPSLVSERGERDRLIAALGPDAERGTAPALRRSVLGVLTSIRPGGAPRDRGEVLARLAWLAPRKAATQRAVADAVLAEADLIGFTAGGGLLGYSRTLLDGSRTAAEHALANALPAPVDHFLVQPDLTAVVPGQPADDLGDMLAVAADLESSGGAHVYRFSEASVRRALDSGRTGPQLLAFLERHSRTPLPQALTYLVDDVSRRYGALRTGSASSYLRCDDEALLTRVVSDRQVQSVHLRVIAPGVAVSPSSVTRVLEALRHAGYAPAAESPDGQIVSLTGDLPRAPSRTSARIVRPRAALESAGQVNELVRRIRAGDTLTELSARVQPLVQQVPGVTSATTMALLRQAIRDGSRVLLGCAEPDGTVSRHTILPISLAGGFVRGHEPASDRLQAYPLHRLTAVSLVADDVEPGDEPA